MKGSTPPRPGCGAAAVATGLAVIACSCNSTVLPPPPPADPATVFVLHEALHTGLVLPPGPDDADGYVEFGFGDWSWYALGHDAWYHVFATVLLPTRGTLGRRVFGARRAADLPRAAAWAEVTPIVVSAAKAQRLRDTLQREFEARAGEAVARHDLRFLFTPSDQSYWFPHNCADVAAQWLEQLDCAVGWALVRTGIHVASPAKAGG